MRLSELFVKEAMDLDLKQQTRSEVLAHLAKNFADCGGVSDVKSYVEALEKREEQSTTGVGDEIAIPHAQHESIKEAAIIFGRSQEGVEWQSFDGRPAKLIFMIAAPKGGSNEHLDALAKLSSVLLNEEAKELLLKAENPDQVVGVFEKFQEDEFEPVSEGESAEDAPFILAVTACPTGIAHTFMAEEKLNQAANEMGVNIKVETNAQAGINNRLTREDIDKASAIIVAADKQVEMARFDGKPVVITKVADGINKAHELIEQAVNQDAPIYHAKEINSDYSEDSVEGESLGRKFYKHLMNGVSHMLPFVVAGGILIAISFFWGINSADPSHETYNGIAGFFNTVGNLAFAMMLPVLAGYIGDSIADRPGLVIGFMGGIFSNPGILSAINLDEGVFAGAESSGFLGALVAGFLAGGIVKLLQKAFSWLPKSLEGMKPIFIYPVLGTLIMAVLMFYVVNAPMGAVMNGIQSLLASIPREYSILLGFVVGAMMAIDMGGPINKAAYVTGTALVSAAGGAGSDVMAAVMVGGMVPPTAIAVAATIKKDLFKEEERSSALLNYVMGAAFITEGAIPFAAANPIRVIPALAIGAGVAGAISMTFNCVSYVPHGGVFAMLVGGVSNPLMYAVAWIVGSLVGGILLVLLLRKSNNS